MTNHSESRLSRRSATLAVVAAIADASCAGRERQLASPPEVPSPSPPAPASESATPAPVPRLVSSPAKLRALLAHNRQRDPTMSFALTNHLSMALSALAWLGGSDAQLQALADQHAPLLEPLRRTMPLASDDWRASIGEPQALVGLSQHFEGQLAARGREPVLREVLPPLLPGLSGALFHGMIRTAYAAFAEDDAELALALAYFATVARPLRPLPQPAQASLEPADERLSRALRDPRFGRRRGGVDISAAFRAATELPGFDETVADLELRPGTIDDLARAALRFYLGTHDFVALHAVTSTHALRQLLPYLAEPELALRYQFQALLAARLSVVERKPRELGAAPPDWPRLLEAALTRTDDHDLKLVYTCLEEDRRGPSLGYRQAAALRLGLG